MVFGKVRLVLLEDAGADAAAREVRAALQVAQALHVGDLRGVTLVGEWQCRIGIACIVDSAGDDRPVRSPSMKLTMTSSPMRGRNCVPKLMPAQASDTRTHAVSSPTR